MPTPGEMLVDDVRREAQHCSDLAASLSGTVYGGAFASSLIRLAGRLREMTDRYERAQREKD